MMFNRYLVLREAASAALAASSSARYRLLAASRSAAPCDRYLRTTRCSLRTQWSSVISAMRWRVYYVVIHGGRAIFGDEEQTRGAFLVLFI